MSAASTSTSSQTYEKDDDVKIPVQLPLPVKVSLGVIAVVLLLLQRCWAALIITAIIFTAVYWVFGGFFALIVLLVSLSTILYHAEDGLIYHPNSPKNSRSVVLDPSLYKMPYESFKIRSSDGTLIHLFLIRQPEPLGSSAPTILFLHGNAGNIGHRLRLMCGFFHLLKANLLMLEYRGYGLSQGYPKEAGLYADAKAAIDYLFSRHDINHKEIIVFGRSLGGAVAVDLASHPDYLSKVWCLLLENTFTGIPDMGRVLVGSFLRFVPLICYKNKYLSSLKIKSVTAPTLFLSGLADSLVPPPMMADLHARCGSSFKYLAVFNDGTHNETYRCNGYFATIVNFISEVRSKTEALEDKSTIRTQPLLHSTIKSV